MIVAIHADTVYEDRYGEAWARCLEARGVEVRWVDLTAGDALAQVAGADGVMCRYGHLPEDTLVAPRVLAAIEHVLGVPVFPEHRDGWHYDDKLSQYFLLHGAGFPMPRTWVFWDMASAHRWATEASYPVIFKLSAGSSGLNVHLVHSAAEAEGLIARMFGPGIAGGMVDEPPGATPAPRSALRRAAGRGRRALREFLGRAVTPPSPPPRRWRLERGYAYFQEWVPDNAYDTRIYVIGDRAWGYRRYPQPGDFRASRAGGPRDYEPAKIDPRMLELAFAISRRLAFRCMAYDMMLLRGEPVVLELSYTFGFLSHNCPGHWTPALDWIPGQTWPYEAQVEDFVRAIEARRAGGGNVGARS